MMKQFFKGAGLLLASFLWLTLSAVEIPFTSQFTDGTKLERQGTKGSFIGILPLKWNEDFTKWAQADCSTSIVEENGRKFLRFNISRLQTGLAQFSIKLDKIKPNQYYKLKIEYRNDTSADVNLGIRMIPSPWNMISQVDLISDSRWHNEELLLKTTPKMDSDYGLFLQIPGPGIIDISSISLSETDASAISSSVERPVAGTKNFFRNSRFPLGLQAGWNFNRAAEEVSADSDKEDKGPSGTASLKISAQSGATLFSEPFQTSDPSAKNNIAFYAKTSGKWIVKVLEQGKAVQTSPIPESKDWKKLQFSFKSNAAAKSYSLAFEGQGTLKIDSLEAYAGDERQTYLSAGDAETALSLPFGDVSESRIQFEDEEAFVLYCASGKIDGASLKIKVCDIYGNEKELEPIHLKPDANGLAQGKINYTVFEKSKYGQFRIESRIEKDGKLISPYNELVVTRLKRPLYWGKDAPNSPFGGHFLSVSRVIKAHKAAGMNWARLHDAGFEYIGWFWLEPEKGNWQFRDSDIMRYRDNNIKIFGQLGTAPEWASYLRTVKTGRTTPSYHDRYFQPVDMNDFRNYVKTVVSRYKGVIDEYFVWNEPWNPAWWGTGYKNEEYTTSQNPTGDFEKLTKAARESAKAVYPEVKISGFNSKGSGSDWTEGVLKAGGLSSCDIIDYHFYTPALTGYKNDPTDAAWKQAIGPIEKENPSLADKPVYMSEGQGSSTGSLNPNSFVVYSGLYKHVLPYKNNDNYIRKADMNCRFILSHLSLNVKKIFLYSSHCYNSMNHNSLFLIMLGSDGYPHPVMAAHSEMAWQLEDRKFVKTIELSNRVYAFIFEGRGATVAVISGAPGAGQYSFKKPQAGGISSLLGISDKYSVNDLFGNPIEGEVRYEGQVFYISAPVSADEMEKQLRN